MEYIVGIDIGGSWIKASYLLLNEFESDVDLCSLVRCRFTKLRSNLTKFVSSQDFCRLIEKLLCCLNIPFNSVAGMGISTAGIVSYHGDRLLDCAEHLICLKSDEWLEYLHSKITKNVYLINDAEAVTIGAAKLHYFSGGGCAGIMPVGTGVGFSILRNGRRWSPQFTLPLLGSIFCPTTINYDKLISASLLAKSTQLNELSELFANNNHSEIRELYMYNLAGVINTASIIYGINTLFLGGGLVDVIVKANKEEFFLSSIKKVLNDNSNNNLLDVKLLGQGNILSVLGAVYLARAEYLSRQQLSTNEIKESFLHRTRSQLPYDSSLELEKMDTDSILRILDHVENEVSNDFKSILGILSNVIDKIYNKFLLGGRLIYVGCGTSGRLAAVDAVELSCTFGFPKERVLAVIAGGIADAAIEIEHNFEEDASAVPDLLMLNLSPNDVVIGISVSGSAFFVQTALAFAKTTGAYSVLIQDEMESEISFCHNIIPLNSGSEIIAGSTRMKGGTSTKKILNYLSTTLMIKLGRVHGVYMSNMQCLNNKLKARALNIVSTLLSINKTMAEDILVKYNWNVGEVLKCYLYG